MAAMTLMAEPLEEAAYMGCGRDSRDLTLFSSSAILVSSFCLSAEEVDGLFASSDGGESFSFRGEGSSSGVSAIGVSSFQYVVNIIFKAFS
jgi:hypothetical protein